MDVFGIVAHGETDAYFRAEHEVLAEDEARSRPERENDE